MSNNNGIANRFFRGDDGDMYCEHTRPDPGIVFRGNTKTETHNLNEMLQGATTDEILRAIPVEVLTEFPTATGQGKVIGEVLRRTNQKVEFERSSFISPSKTIRPKGDPDSSDKKRKTNDTRRTRPKATRKHINVGHVTAIADAMLLDEKNDVRYTHQRNKDTIMGPIKAITDATDAAPKAPGEAMDTLYTQSKTWNNGGGKTRFLVWYETLSLFCNWMNETHGGFLPSEAAAIRLIVKKLRRATARSKNMLTFPVTIKRGLEDLTVDPLQIDSESEEED